MALSELENRLKEHRIAVIDREELGKEIRTILEESKLAYEFIFYDQSGGEFVDYRMRISPQVEEIIKNAAFQKARNVNNYDALRDIVKAAEEELKDVRASFRFYEDPTKAKDHKYLKTLGLILEQVLAPESIRSLETKYGLELKPTIKEVNTAGLSNITVQYEIVMPKAGE